MQIIKKVRPALLHARQVSLVFVITFRLLFSAGDISL